MQILQVESVVSSTSSELVIVRAGAGAGKTTELVSRVLDLAKKFKIENSKYPHFVVTTFTRKATQELRERLVKKSLELNDPDLIEFVQKPSCLHISTIHGILSVFLIRYGIKMGLNPRFSMMDARAEEKMIKKILREMLSNPEDAVELETLLEVQPLGKIIESLQEYYEARVGCKSALKIENIETQKKLIIDQDKKWIQNGNALLLYIEQNESSSGWQEYAGLLKLSIQNLQKYDLSLRLNVYKNFTENKPTVKFKKSTDDEIKSIRDEIHDQAKEINIKGWAQSEEVLGEHQELAQAFVDLAENIYNKLIEQKISTAQLTMSDLEVLSFYLIQKYPETAKHFSKEWDYWLVDEYQDTSPRQMQLLQSLIGERNSFTVGDPQQSIYLFRGARSEVFLEKENEIKKRGGKLLSKMKNYRSRPELLFFLNKFFTSLGPQFKPMEPTEQAVKPQFESEPAASYLKCAKEDEDQTIIDRCLQLVQTGIAPEKICVLSRTNNRLDQISKLAAKVGLPVQVHAAAKFYLRREIRDALAQLKFLINPSDNVNLVELLRSPWFRLSDNDILKICHKHDESYWTLAKTTLAENEVVVRLINLQSQLTANGITQVWIQGLLESGIFDFSNTIDPSGRREANLWKLISMLKQEERSPGFNYLEFAARLEKTQTDVESGADGDATPVEEPKRVNLMTIHASKGLQFDHVILTTMNRADIKAETSFFILDEDKQSFTLAMIDPENNQLVATAAGNLVLESKKNREVAEYDRQLYVALTRAKIAVSLIWSEPQKTSWAGRMWIPSEGEGFNTFEDKKFKTVYVENYKPELKAKKLSIATPIQVIKPYRLKDSTAKQSQTTASVTEVLGDLQTLNLKQDLQHNSQLHVHKVIDGIQTHRLFENLKYHDLKIDSGKYKKAYDFIIEWNQGQILKLIKQGEVEWGFCVSENSQTEGKWVQGQIDLWAIDNNVVWVVDYKTGSEEYLEKAFEQLDIYAWALQKMGKAPAGAEVRRLVVYPFSSVVHERKASTIAVVEGMLIDRQLKI